MKTTEFDSPQKALVFSLVLLFVLAGSVVLMFWTGQKALSSYWETKALAQEGVELDKRIEYLNRAANIESGDDGTWRMLSQLLVSKAVNLAQEERSKNEKENRKALQDLQRVSRSAIQSAKRATDIDPTETENWGNLGNVYLNLIPYAQGSASQAVDAYNKAIEYNPNNPSLYLRKARSQLLLAQRIERQIAQLRQSRSEQAQTQLQSLQQQRDEVLKKGEEFAKEAIEKKRNYSSAHMFLTNLYDRQGEIDQAIAQLSNVVIINPQNAGLYFQLGLLHYKNDDLDKAQASFQEALSINSDYANARYFLGLVYARQDKSNKALEEFQKIANTNPDNEEIKKIISNLEQGRAPLSGIAPPAQEPTARDEAPVEEQGAPGTQTTAPMPEAQQRPAGGGVSNE